MTLLLVHSHWSLLTGPSSPKALCEEAARLGHDHLALVDTNGLYGFLPFARECRRMGLRALYGVELVAAGRRLFALAEDAQGYRSLCRLTSARSLDGTFRLALSVAEHAAGLRFVCADLRLLLEVHERVPRGALWIALPPGAHGSEGEPVEVPDVARKCPPPLRWPSPAALREAAEALGLPLVAVWESWFARPEHFRAHRIFVAVKTNRALEGEDGELARPQQHLPSRAELAAAFGGEPAACALARDLVARATLDFPESGAPIFPVFEVPDGTSPTAHLAALATAGLAERMPTAAPDARARLARELAVIAQMGFAPYFLVVREIAELARTRGIPCVGRGSAADSLVAYALGLTEADPLRYGLLFERFLNPARKDLPDIDLDFCWRRRDELLSAVYDRFGHDKVAMIATYATLGPRGAYREAAKALGIPPREVDRRCKQLPWHGQGETPLSELAAASPGLLARLSEDPDRERAILAVADLLQSAPSHLGIHAGGVVITPGPIVDHVPLERAAKGFVVTQFDMRFVEQLGLVKIDLLGNRALTILADAQAALAREGRAVPALGELPEDDPKTAQLVRTGRTLGCFQIESPAMRTLLRQLRAATTERVIQAVALVRPGPSASGMKDAFVRRARGEEKAEPLHPLLASTFADTFGILLYQEDVIRAAMAIAGVDAAQGDTLRRTLGKLQNDPRGGKEVFDRFLVAGLRNGHEPALVAEAWDAMARFSGFSFCKAHSVTYGRIAWRCAWLKAHEPVAFFAALLGNDAGFYAKGVYVEEAKRLGIAFLPPCVERGERTYSTERGAIRVGLMDVKELGDELVQRVLAERARGGPFGSLGALAARVPMGEKQLERLILCGACDAFGPTRPELLLELRLRARLCTPAGTAEPARALFPPLRPARDEFTVPVLPEYSPERRIELELETLGFSLARHPVDALFGATRPKNAIPLGAIEAHLGKRIVVHGWIVALRRIHTREGDPMLFFTLEDATGIVEVVVFPDRHAEIAPVLQGRGPYVVTGVLEDAQGGVNLRASCCLHGGDRG